MTYIDPDYTFEDAQPDRVDFLADDDRSMFADPGGRSALRAGVRKFPCPDCGRKNALTAEDVRLHYRCDRCADAAERGIDL